MTIFRRPTTIESLTPSFFVSSPSSVFGYVPSMISCKALGHSPIFGGRIERHIQKLQYSHSLNPLYQHTGPRSNPTIPLRAITEHQWGWSASTANNKACCHVHTLNTLSKTSPTQLSQWIGKEVS